VRGVPDGDRSTKIDAEPKRVWQIVSDIELSSRFPTEVSGAEWLDGAVSAAQNAKAVTRRTPQRSCESSTQAAHCIILTTIAELATAVIALRAAARRRRPDRVRRRCGASESVEQRDYRAGVEQWRR